MSTLDAIAQERQRLAERLAKIDSERAKLAEQLAELEAAERVLSRFTTARPPPRRGRAVAGPEPASPAVPRGGRGGRRGPRAAPAAPQSATLSLGDATLRAVAAHAGGITAEEVRGYLASQFGMEVRPNHLGMALQRHRRSGRLVQRGSLWLTPQAAGNAEASLEQEQSAQ
jgi:hypothetical protein